MRVPGVGCRAQGLLHIDPAYNNCLPHIHISRITGFLWRDEWSSYCILHAAQTDDATAGYADDDV